jgi:hypothetical protein
MEQSSMANVTDPNVGGIDPLKPSVPPPSIVPPVGQKLGLIDERIRSEILDLERQIAELEEKTKDGSGLQAAQELHKLAAVVQEKAAQVKAKAQATFLGNSETPELTQQKADACCDAPQKLNEKGLPSDVQQQIADLEERVAALGSPNKSDDPVAVADLLDNAAIALEQKAEEIVERKRDVAAQELNDLDGFDR